MKTECIFVLSLILVVNSTSQGLNIINLNPVVDTSFTHNVPSKTENNSTTDKTQRQHRNIIQIIPLSGRNAQKNDNTPQHSTIQNNSKTNPIHIQNNQTHKNQTQTPISQHFTFNSSNSHQFQKKFNFTQNQTKNKTHNTDISNITKNFSQQHSEQTFRKPLPSNHPVSGSRPTSKTVNANHSQNNSDHNKSIHLKPNNTELNHNVPTKSSSTTHVPSSQRESPPINKDHSIPSNDQNLNSIKNQSKCICDADCDKNFPMSKIFLMKLTCNVKQGICVRSN